MIHYVRQPAENLVCCLLLGRCRTTCTSQGSVKVQHHTSWFSVFPPDKFGIERYLYKGQCLDACPEAFYHTKDRSCERCSDHCRLCTSPTHCLKCNSSYYISDGVCAKLECEEGKQGHCVIYKLIFFCLLCYTVTECQRCPWKVPSHTCTHFALSHTLFLWLFLSFFHALLSF